MPRLLLIGLDAMEWNLVDRWADEGKMPVLGRLRQGYQAKLASTAEQLPDTVWASLYTGTNPAKFRKYFYVQYDPASGGLKYLKDEDFGGIPFWDILSDHGKRVVVVDAPKYPASKRLNGLQVTNWGAHATNAERSAVPAALLNEIDQKFARHPVGHCDDVDSQKPESLRNLRDRVLTGVAEHGRLFRWLMEKDDWDVFFANFSEPHCIGHHFWHLMDEHHPQHPKSNSHGLSDTIERVYCALDQEIGKLIETAGEDTTILIFSGHGMGPIYHASWNLGEILDLLGYGRDLNGVATNREANRKAKTNFWRMLRIMLPGKLQYAIKNSLPKRLQQELLFRWYAGRRGWAGKRAFAIPNNDSVGAIRIAVRGRDKHGLVEPGEEYDRVCQEIKACLEELTDPVTGRNVVRKVTITKTLFHGPHLEQLPDITVLWEQEFAWRAIHSPRFGTLQIQEQDGRTGSHTPYGFLLARGAGFVAGKDNRIRSLYDIAPTALALAQVPIPDHMDGEVIVDLSRTNCNLPRRSSEKHSLGTSMGGSN